MVQHHLKPGGILYLLEFHPFYLQFNDDGELQYSYFHRDTPDEDVLTHTYTDGEPHEPQREHWWNHTLTDVINAIRNQRLQIELIHEFPYSAYQLGEGMREIEPVKWVNAKLGDRIPYMFSIKAHRLAAD